MNEVAAILARELDFEHGLWHARGMLTTQQDDSAVPSPTSEGDEMRVALDRLSRHAFEHGLYDRNAMPEGGSDE